MTAVKKNTITSNTKWAQNLKNILSRISVHKVSAFVTVVKSYKNKVESHWTKLKTHFPIILLKNFNVVESSSEQIFTTIMVLI